MQSLNSIKDSINVKNQLVILEIGGEKFTSGEGQLYFWR